MSDGLDFANLTGRPPGRLTEVLGHVVPGVAAVHAQAAPYAAAWHEANLKAFAGENRRCVVFGDSLSQGLEPPTPFRGWVCQFADRLPVQVDIVNLSETGARIADVLSQQIPAWLGLPPAPKGEIVTLLIGSNDLVKRQLRDQLPAAFEQLLARLPDQAIVATLPAPHRIAGAVGTVIDAAHVSRGLRVADVTALGSRGWRGRLAADHWHPNEAGYAAIADVFEPFVLEAAIAPQAGDTRGAS
jgi:lysophospholipase L1-like esterase